MPNHMRVVSQAESLEGPETKVEAPPKRADGQAAPPPQASDPDTPPKREGGHRRRHALMGLSPMRSAPTASCLILPFFE